MTQMVLNSKFCEWDCHVYFEQREVRFFAFGSERQGERIAHMYESASFIKDYRSAELKPKTG